MHETQYNKVIEAFFFPDKYSMNKALLTDAEGISFAKDNVCGYIFARKFNGYTRHELCHVFSINLWGRSETWIEEGFATLADEDFQTEDFHKQVKSLLGTDKFIGAEELFAHFNRYNGNW